MERGAGCEAGDTWNVALAVRLVDLWNVPWL